MNIKFVCLSKMTLAGLKAIWVLQMKNPSLFWILHNQCSKAMLLQNPIIVGFWHSSCTMCAQLRFGQHAGNPSATCALGFAQPTDRQPKRHVCAKVCLALRQDTMPRAHFLFLLKIS